jgi:hypothetical protein
LTHPTNEQLIEKLERMEARIRALESELHRKGEADANHGFKAHVANTRGKLAKGPANAAEAPAPGGYETAALESPPPPNYDLFGVAPSPLPGLKIGAYGEPLRSAAKFGRKWPMADGLRRRPGRAAANLSVQ